MSPRPPLLLSSPPPRVEDLAKVYYAELRVDYFLFGDVRRLDYPGFKRTLVAETIGKITTVSPFVRSSFIHCSFLPSLHAGKSVDECTGVVQVFDEQGEEDAEERERQRRILGASALTPRIRTAHPSVVFKHLVPVVWQVLTKAQLGQREEHGAGDGDIIRGEEDAATLVLRVYGAYSRRFYGFPSHKALRDPDGAFRLGSIEAEIRKHPNARCTLSQHSISVQELVKKMTRPNTTVATLINSTFGLTVDNTALQEEVSRGLAEKVQVFPLAILDRTFDYVRNTWHKVETLQAAVLARPESSLFDSPATRKARNVLLARQRIQNRNAKRARNLPRPGGNGPHREQGDHSLTH